MVTTPDAPAASFDGRVIQNVTAPNALSAPYGDRVIQNGPGMHLNLMFTAGGNHVEKVSTKLANMLGWGPVAATQAIESFFGDGAARLERLDQLYLLRQPAPTSSARPRPDLRNRRLGVLCGEVLKYTKGCVSHIYAYRVLDSKLPLAHNFQTLNCWLLKEL